MAHAVVPQFSTLFNSDPQNGDSALGKASSTETSVADIDGLRGVTDRAMRMAGADGAALAIQHQGSIVCLATAGWLVPPLGAVLDSDEGLSGQCIRTGETLVCRDSAADARVNAEACRRLGARSMVLVPVRTAGRIVGVLEVFSGRPDRFSTDVIPGLEKLAESVTSSPVSADAAPQSATEDGGGKPGTVPGIPKHMPELTFLGADASLALVERELRGSRQKLLAALFICTVLLVGWAATRSVLSRQAAQPANPRPIRTAPEDVLRSSAERGDPTAQFRLAVDLENGRIPARDRMETLRWLQKAADSGNADAQYELGNVLAEGKSGVQQDTVGAQLWYLVAQFSGNPHAEAAARALAPRLTLAEVGRVRFQLAQMFAAGAALPRDDISAYVWFTLAQEAGFPAAQEKARLAAHMTKRQIDLGARQANTWIEQHRNKSKQIGMAGTQSPAP